ncbi:MAG: hypothetical protein ACD_11C00133G0002 [uncultured bacterium]|nr:MAG: hypothetical protein ACD_11C00133G0002 [uncultured bacterium]HBR71962.1 hypothetical protein [Candidatus Moranbacteria bacterium]
MFFSDPGFDLKVSLGLLIFSVIIGLIVLVATKNKFKALVIFSVLGNLSFLVNIGSRMFIAYNIKWIGYFALVAWPIINIYLLIKYFSKK